MQISMISFVTLIFLLINGWPGAKSALFGGMIAFIPNLYFAIKFGRRDTNPNMKQVVNSFYTGEAIKLTLTAVLFSIVFQLPGIQYLALFCGFGSVLTAFWFALLMRGNDL